MSQEIYQGLLTERAAIRDLYAALQEKFDACMTLAAPKPPRKAWRGQAIRRSPWPFPDRHAGGDAAGFKGPGFALGLQVIGFVDQTRRCRTPMPYNRSSIHKKQLEDASIFDI